MKYLIVAYVVISSLTLSSTTTGAAHGHPNQHLTYSTDAVERIDRPANPTIGITIDLVSEDFETPKSPVPYAEIWDNPLNQTAQQYVAILSLFRGRPIPADIFQLIKLQQEARLMEAIRVGILTGRLAPKPIDEMHELEIPDTTAWVLIGLGSFLFLIGAYANWKSLRDIRRANRL